MFFLNKKGSLVIEYVIILLIFLLMFLFLLDFTIIMWNNIKLHQLTNSTIRTLSIQGGIRPQVMHGEYVSSGRLLTRLNNSLVVNGDFDEFAVFVNGQRLTNTTNINVPYGQRVEVMIEARYSWRGVTSYIGTNNLRNRRIAVEKSAISFGM